VANFRELDIPFVKANNFYLIESGYIVAVEGFLFDVRLK
jgi:hypothetical protein